MAIADFLREAGSGLAKAGKVAGAVLEPVGKAVAEEESGQLPEIEREKRQRKFKAQDEETARQAKFLENQLALDEKYGTLTPEQRTQLKQTYSSLGKTKQEPSIIQKLLKHTHPTGATYQTYSADATPEGGTAAQDETMAENRAKILASARRPSREYASPDNSRRDWFQPGEEPEGWNAVTGTPKASRPMIVRLANGQPGFATPQPDGSFKDQSGQVVQSTPFQKPPSAIIKQGTAQGRNVYAQLTENGWVDAGTKQPLQDFKPQPSFAQTGMWGLDTGYDANGNPTALLLDRRTGHVRPAPAGIVAPLMAKDIETARSGAIAADTRLRNMVGAADKAKKGDQQAMLAITANHIGMTLGAQKGARINQAVWNEAVESAPWLGRAKAHFGADGYLSGVVLSPDQVDQMVDLGKLVRQTSWQAASQQAAAANVPLQVPEFQMNLQVPTPGAKPIGGLIKPNTGAKPAGATMKVPGSDGKMHWSDGKVDLGVVQ